MNDQEKMLLIAFNKVMGTSLEELNVERKTMPEWDSMKHAELIIQLQKTFHRKFSIPDVIEISNLKDFLPLIQ